MMQTILEIKEKLLCGTRLEFECELLSRGQGEAVVLYRLPRAGELEGVYLSEGAVSVGYFWEDRPYNVYHFVAADGQTLALYINISDSTQISVDTLHWRDLIVDLMIEPGGACRVLDEHELPDQLDADLRLQITSATELLVTNAQTLLDEMTLRSRKLLKDVISKP